MKDLFMPLKLMVSTLLIMNAYISLIIPTAYAESGCLPRAVVEEYGIYSYCPYPGPIGVRRGKKYGFIDHEGNVLVDFLYDKVEAFEDGIASVAIRSDSGDLLWGQLMKMERYWLRSNIATLCLFQKA